MDRTESIILRALIYDDQFVRQVMPYLESTYFLDKTEQTIFNKIKEFVEKYNVLPTKESLIVDLSNMHGVEQDDLNAYVVYLDMLELARNDDPPHINWLVERTEEWCQEQAVHLAVVEVINILDGKNKKTPKGMIPKLLQDALSVTFDPHVGHDYLEDADARYEFYHRVDARIPFHLDYFNLITKNGVPNKTLNLVIAGIGIGKSLCLCDMAANYLLKQKNILYITMEMSEEAIAERIDANTMNRALDDLPFMSKEGYQKQIASIEERTKGKLIIKEYPGSSVHVGHFRHLLNELQLKKKFKPDVIFVDYLNICGSSRLKSSASLYEIVKAVAEELRGLAVEMNVPVWTATQFNRSGYASNDPDMTNSSECIWIEEKVRLSDGNECSIGDLVVKDAIAGYDGIRIVGHVYERHVKDCIEIQLKSGKKIVVSKDHQFPTNKGLLSFNNGLVKGDFLNSCKD